MLVNGWPAGKVGPGDTEGSTRLASSGTDGSRQPLRPPVVSFAQWNRALGQFWVFVSGDCSHTSPVSLSRTAAPPKSVKTVKRELFGSFLSQFLVTPAFGSSSTGGAGAASVLRSP